MGTFGISRDRPKRAEHEEALAFELDPREMAGNFYPHLHLTLTQDGVEWPNSWLRPRPRKGEKFGKPEVAWVIWTAG